MIFLTSCGRETLTINSTKTSTHDYVDNTDIYLSPVFGWKRVNSVYNGFQDPNMQGSISVRYSDKSIEEFDKIYSESNLKRTKKEQLESNPVKFNGNKGLWIKFFDEPKKRIRYFFAIDTGDNTLVAKAWLREKAESYYDKDVKESLRSIYFATEEEIMLGEETIKLQEMESKAESFFVNDSTFQYVGIFDGKLVYTRDKKYPTESSDNAVIKLTPPQFNVLRTEYKNSILPQLLGANYKIRSENVIKILPVDKIEEWIAESMDGQTFGYVGYVKKHYIFLFQASCTNNFNENIEEFRKFIKSARINPKTKINM